MPVLTRGARMRRNPLSDVEILDYPLSFVGAGQYLFIAPGWNVSSGTGFIATGSP
jgi:hypothetical protein